MTAKTETASPKAAPAKKTESGNGHGSTIRQRVFEALSKNGGMTGAAVKEALGLSGVPSLLKDELFGSKPRIRRKQVEGARGVVYELTATGKADLKAGKVDSNAADVSNGVPVPDGR